MAQMPATSKSTKRRLVILKQTEIDKIFPLINITKLQNIKPREMGTRSFRVKNCKHKGLQIHIRFVSDEGGDRWTTCHAHYSQNAKEIIDQETIMFLIDNFFGYELDVISMHKHEGKKVDRTKEVFLYANIDTIDIFSFKEDHDPEEVVGEVKEEVSDDEPT